MSGVNHLSWIRSYLRNRKHCVGVGDATSGYREINNIGVPQGSVGGPILFLVYINDLPSVSNTLKTTLFADDTVVSLAHPNLTSLVMSVNSELDVLCDWFQSNRLSLNTTKTYAMLCSASSIRGDQLPNLEMNGAVLPLIEQVKYLGIILDNQLLFKSHIDSIAKGGDTRPAIHALTHAVSAAPMLPSKFCLQPLPKSTTSSVRFSPAIHVEFSVVINVAWGGCACRRRCYCII